MSHVNENHMDEWMNDVNIYHLQVNESNVRTNHTGIVNVTRNKWLKVTKKNHM